MIAAGHGPVSGKQIYDALSKLPLMIRGEYRAKICPPNQEAKGVTVLAGPSLMQSRFDDYDSGYSLTITLNTPWANGFPQEDVYLITVARIPKQNRSQELPIEILAIDHNGNGRKDGKDRGDFGLLSRLMHQAHRFAENPTGFQRPHCVPKKPK